MFLGGKLRMDTTTRNLAVLLVISIGFPATNAYAQSDAGVLEEILVTAQKRTQSLQDVPISVSVMTGEKMAEAAIENLDDLALYVPNFSKGDSGIGAIIQIRGIATGSNPGFEQSVVTYMDDISLARSGLARMPFMDLERVEVLRGPQNVLFGKNSIAGAISMVTAKPTEELDGNVSLRYGWEYEDSEAVAVLSGPFSDTFRGRIALRQAERGGYYDNAGNGRTDEGRDETAIRATLAWDIGDRTEVLFKYEQDKVESTGSGEELIFEYTNPFPFDPVLNPLSGLTYTQSVAALEGAYNAALAGFGLPPISVGSDDAVVDRVRRSNVDERHDLDLDLMQLTLNHDFDGFTFTSVTGFIEFDEETFTGSSSGIDISKILSFEEYEQFSQEFRLTSEAGGRFDWIAGAFYQDWELKNDESTLVDEMNMPVLLGLLGAAPGLEAVANLDSTRQYWGDSKSYAAFGQFTFNMSDTARVTLGGRYTREEKNGRRFVDIISTATGEFDLNQAIFASCAFGVDYESLGQASIGPIGAFIPDCTGNFVGPGAYSTHDVSGNRTESSFTPSIVGEFDIGDSHMLYASYSEGFKAGGFDARAPRESDIEYEDETVQGFELGLKSTLAGGKAETNIAVFHSTYKDLQVSSFDGVAGFVVGNAAKSTAQGFEADGRWRATENLTLFGSLAYLDNTYDSYPNTPCSPRHTQLTGEVLCDRSGNRLSYVPEWSASLVADFTLPINGDLDFRSTLDLNYESDYFTNSTQEAFSVQDSYTMYNLRLALEAEKWTFAILGKNLTDEYVLEFTSVVPLSGSSLQAPAYKGFAQPPRTISAQFEYRF
jgi:iron complex outermembrane receptor protein